MKRTLMIALLLAAGVGLSGTAMAADGTTLYKGKCAACHGADGKGTAMAPAFEGNEFISSSTDEEIAAVILNGRNGAEKKYKKFAIGMPAQKLPDADVKALVEHLKSFATAE